MLLNYDKAKISDYDKVVASLVGVGSKISFETKHHLDFLVEKHHSPSYLLLNHQNYNLKKHPPHLKYVSLESNNTLMVLISIDLKQEKVEIYITVLNMHIRALVG